MEKLLETFSLTEIVTFIVLFGLALKGVVSFFDWFANTNIKFFRDKYQKPKELYNTVDQLSQLVKDLTKKVDMLVDSDKDAIKAYITQRHHHFVYKKGWIDDYSLDCIERRYVHYEDEGGNSFIGNLMSELRQIPRRPQSSMNTEEEEKKE